MYALEESDRIDFTKLACDAVHKLHRMVEKSPVSPMMTPTNPHRQRMLRDIRLAVKKAKGTVTLYVHLSTKAYSVDTKLQPAGIYRYEIEFRDGKLIDVRDAHPTYTG